MRVTWALAILSPAAACHTLLGIEDTTVGDQAGPVGLDRIIVAEVRSSQVPVVDGPPPARGALVLADFLEDSAPPPAFDGRDARGYGCVVHVRDSISIAHTRNEGEIQITGTATPVPPCNPLESLNGRYACADRRASSPDPDSVADEPDSRALATVAGANPPFSADDVGLFLQLGDAAPRPIVAIQDDVTAELFDPFAAGEDHMSAMHAVIAGLGPTPANRPLFDGAVTIAKLNGDRTESFSITTTATGAQYRLDANSDRPEALPIDGSAVTFSCSGLNGDCGGGTHVAVWARTTDVRGPALPPSNELAPIEDAEAELRCLFEGSEAEIPGPAMQALLSTAPRRIAVAVMRGTIKVPTNADGSRPTVVFTGFGDYGWTTISQPDDDCDGVFQDCSPGLRCTIEDQPSGSPARRCIADGTAELGASCTPRTGQPDDPPTDDCVAGTGCVLDVCRSACDVEDTPCGAGEVCTRFSEMLIDFCLPQCDPLDQSTCDDPSQGCYLFGSSGVCATSSFIVAGASCQGPNECEPGTQCVGNAIDGSNLLCRTICDVGACPAGTLGCGCGGCGSNEVCFPSSQGGPIGFCITDTETSNCDCSMNPACN